MELLDNLEPITAWDEIRAQLRRAVGESTYRIWIAPLELRALDSTLLLLGAPPTIREWVAKRFGRILERCARTVLGSPIRVAIEGDGGDRPGGGATGDGGTRSAAPLNSGQERLNPRYSFEQFIIGDGNRLAHAAALSVAELPGQTFNPLFLHAPPGLGKTHLLHAIGNYITAFGGGARVRYTTAEAFTNQFIGALGTRSVDRFKHAYRGVDVLLIDDVQFLASKLKTEEEFFHTFNALYESGRQLVLTCDRLPHALSGIERRLRERFEGGLIVDIRPPDFATRVAILRKRALLDDIPIADDEVLEAIAERACGSVRALEGALIRVVAHHSLMARPIDAGLASAVLDAAHAERHSSVSIDHVQACVASHYGLQPADLCSPSRAARIAWPRQIAIFLARELTGSSLQTLGDAFGGRDHATIIHACKRVAGRANANATIGAELERLRQLVVAAANDRSC